MFLIGIELGASFGFENDLGHHSYGLGGELTRGGFARQHDRIGTIEDGIRDVTGFGAGRGG